MHLPIDDSLPDLCSALSARGVAVLQAPPGAGKTTRVPLALRDAGVAQRVVMLEPRRLAARAAAERMAQTLGEKVGQSVGYRIRGDAKIGAATRIEVVTEGILTRRLQSDPELAGIDCVIFDEFHERSLNADLGLALCLEVRDALRPDLKLLAMSATLDADPVAKLMGDAPVVTSEGRSFPVETEWLPRPTPKTRGFEDAVADLTLHALDQAEGSALVFLPGEGEIRRVAARLEGRLPSDAVIRPLFGAMDLKAQRAAIAPVNTGRKVVLATSIAETSLTIEDVRIVVDGGKSRRARFDPNTGMSRLVTETVTRAEADQRRGRAGRVAPGVCFRLWTRGEEGARPQFPPAEIEVGDLSGLALELAQWGAQPTDLSFLTQPPEGSYAEAVSLLRMLGAVDKHGHINDHGRAMAAVPAHPRLAHLLQTAGAQAAPLAALLSDRDIAREAGVDLSVRLDILAGRRAAPNEAAVPRVKAEAKRLARGLSDAGPVSVGAMAALAYPDRIGLRRDGDAPRWVLSGGKGARMEPGDALANARLIVATDLDGDPREARVRQAVVLSEAELRAALADQIKTVQLCRWSKRDRKVEARQQEVFGALVLKDQAWRDAPDDALAKAALEGVRDLGLQALRPSPAAERLIARVRVLRAAGADMPDFSEEGLLAQGEQWLLPYLSGVRTAGDLRSVDLVEALRTWLGWDRLQELDRLAPGSFETPLGRKIGIDYAGESPAIEARLQEFFGVTAHPVIGPDRVPLKITLLSPAQRPIAVTSDLPGFWAGSYADVRKDMRGRYPKHPWPEDPTEADPTLRAKRRGG